LIGKERRKDAIAIIKIINTKYLVRYMMENPPNKAPVRAEA
jgi:hypothetical protein